MKAIQLLTAITLVAPALAGALQAQTPDSLRALVVTAENLTATESQIPRPGNSRELRPGDIVRYRLTFTNITPDSVHNVQFNDPVPTGLRYVAGSARTDRSNVLIEFSIDSGRTYSARPEIEEVVNGQQVRRPAPAELYTHVRWSEKGWVRSRGKITAEFSVQLSATTSVAANQ
jgi:uncharacterized repeat protein (TIGR01451 family)